MRRACAAQLHYANTSLEGVATILSEALDQDRTVPFVWALLILNDTMLAATYEHGGAQEALKQFALACAMKAETDEN